MLVLRFILQYNLVTYYSSCKVDRTGLHSIIMSSFIGLPSILQSRKCMDGCTEQPATLCSPNTPVILWTRKCTDRTGSNVMLSLWQWMLNYSKICINVVMQIYTVCWWDQLCFKQCHKMLTIAYIVGGLILKKISPPLVFHMPANLLKFAR